LPPVSILPSGGDGRAEIEEWLDISLPADLRMRGERPLMFAVLITAAVAEAEMKERFQWCLLFALQPESLPAQWRPAR
jgi:hypothetical protein